jgi:hypothetical protein
MGVDRPEEGEGFIGEGWDGVLTLKLERFRDSWEEVLPPIWSGAPNERLDRSP